MISKRKIVAIVLFIIMGFIMFTFANPSDGIDSLTKPIEEEQPVVKPVDNKNDKVITVNPQVVVDNAPVITVNPAIVKIVEGTEYDVKTGVSVTDDKDINLVAGASITSITKAGEYEVTYTVTDSANHTVTATRKIIILSKDDDEDKDGYTNKEEVDNDSDFDDELSIPDDLAPIITVTPETITMEFGTNYDVNKGVEATDDFDSLKNGKLSLVADITDTASLKVGKYTITYTVKDRKENKTTATRIVNIVDTTAPTISLNGNKNITLEAGIDTYTELNATATDAVDGTWTVVPTFIHYSIDGNFMGKVSEVDTKKPGLYKVQYSCTDKAGNKCLDETRSDHDYVLRLVTVVDTTAPTISLNGDKNISLEAGIDTYTELNATATDAVDGTWTVVPTFIHYSIDGKFMGKVSEVDTKKPGLYKVQYSCTDKAGNKCLDKTRSDHDYVLRFVTVADTTAPTISLNGDKNITLEAGVDTYTELNATANDVFDGTWTIAPTFIHYSVDGKFMGKVSEVDTNKPGLYKVQYSCTDKAGNKCLDETRSDHDYVLRYVTVADTTAPIIEGIIDGETYVNTVTYSVSDKYLSKIIVDDKNYTVEEAPYTIISEGLHTVTVLDSSNNSTSVTFTIERRYNVVFKNYDGKVISTESVVSNGDATALAPNMTGKTYVSKGITYTFTNWNKNLNNINENTEVTAVYDITKVIANVYSLNEGLTRPVNGNCSIGGTKDYTKMATAELILTDAIKTITKNNVSKVLTYDAIKVLENIADSRVLPVPTDSEENFTMYEWYTLKYENDGWHIDGEKLLDINKLKAYREDSINEIKKYANDLGFDSSSLEITNIISVSGINTLNTRTLIAEAVTTAKASIDDLLTSYKDQAKIDLANANTGFNESYKVNANQIVTDGNLSITNATTTLGVDKAKTDAITKLNNLKALMAQTFNVSLVNDKNNVLISNIASDVAITKVVYSYSVWSNNVVYNGSSNQISLTISSPLDEEYRDVNNVEIVYTKNGKEYKAIYNVEYIAKYETRYTLVFHVPYDHFLGYRPNVITQISNNYQA